MDVDTPTIYPHVHLRYKGKATDRSWAQLPEEIVQHLATYMLIISAIPMSNSDFPPAYCPKTYDVPHLWQHRMIYTALRDARELEKISAVCQGWASAIQMHPFWKQAVCLLDPADTFVSQGRVPSPNPISHHSHSNSNSSSKLIDPTHYSPYRHFATIQSSSCILCRINSPWTSVGLVAPTQRIVTTQLGLIGICNRHDTRRDVWCGICLRDGSMAVRGNKIDYAAVALNDDDHRWPTVEATCRACRLEALLEQVRARHDGSGGYPQLNPYSVKPQEILPQNILTAGDWESEETVKGFLELGEGYVEVVIQVCLDRWWLKEETRLAEMTSQAVAAAIYDGTAEEDSDEDDMDIVHYQRAEDSVMEFALGDWARMRVMEGYWIAPGDIWYLGVPEPQTVHAEHPCPSHSSTLDHTAPHPSQRTTRGSIPPSFRLCERVHRAHFHEMRAILLPALKNVMSKIAMDSIDPLKKVTGMTLDAVVEILRDELVWFDDVDWLEVARMRASNLVDGHSAKTDERDESEVKAALSPLRNIPYVPAVETWEKIPPGSKDVVKMLWREACAPLYQCHCAICERSRPLVCAPVVQVEVLSEDADADAEMYEDEEDEVDAPTTIGMDEDEYEEVYDDYGGIQLVLQTTRKRSSEELEVDEGDDEGGRKRVRVNVDVLGKGVKE